MMSPLSRTVLIALAVAGAAPASNADTDTFRPVDGFFPQTFAADIEGGNFRLIRREISCGVNALLITAHMNSAHSDPKWVASISVIFNEPAKVNGQQPPIAPDKQMVALRIQAEANGKSLSASIEKHIGQSVTDNVPFSRNWQVGKDIPISVSWTSEGAISATVDGTDNLIVPLGEPVTSMAFSISGADAEIRDIKTGYLGGDTATACPGTKSNSGK